MIIAKEIINPELSKIFLYKKYVNLEEIFSIRLQISYPHFKTTYYLLFINLMNMYIYTNIYIFFIYNKIQHFKTHDKVTANKKIHIFSSVFNNAVVRSAEKKT